MSRAWRTHNLDRAGAVMAASMKGSMKRGGLVVKQEMQARAPVSTGRMTRSVRLGPVTVQGDTFTLLVGPTVDYAKYTELEPWIIGKRPGPKSVAKGATIPWMKPAADAVRSEVQDILRGGLSSTLRQLQGGLASI